MTVCRETARLCDKAAGGYYIYCISSRPVPSGARLNCPMRLGPSCFIDGSLCLQLTQYQHLASENSLGSTSITQPSCTKGTGREGRINLVACRRRWNYQPVCVWTEGYPAISIFCHGLNKVVGGDWAFWGSADWKASRQCLLWRWGNNCTSTRGDAVHLSPSCNKKLKLSSRCRWCGVMVQHTCTTLSLLDRGLFIIQIWLSLRVVLKRDSWKVK